MTELAPLMCSYAFILNITNKLDILTELKKKNYNIWMSFGLENNKNKTK